MNPTHTKLNQEPELTPEQVVLKNQLIAATNKLFEEASKTCSAGIDFTIMLATPAFPGVVLASSSSLESLDRMQETFDRMIHHEKVKAMVQNLFEGDDEEVPNVH